MAAVLTAVWSPVRCSPTELSRSWVYPYLYELRLREGGAPLFLNTGPYTRRDIARWVSDLSTDRPEPGRRSAWLISALSREIPEPGPGDERFWWGQGILGSELETDRRFKAQALIRFQAGGDGFSAWTVLRSSINAPEFHRTETRAWGDRSRATFDQGGLGLSRGGFGLFVGRDELSWGVSRLEGMMLSGSAPSHDMIKLSLGSRRLLFTSVHSWLRHGENDPWGQNVRRYISAHRLEVIVNPSFGFGLSEGVIYGGENRPFEPVYLNPLVLFYSEQWNSGYNDNIFLGGDFWLLFPGRAEIRGEVFVDDTQYDLTSEPHEFAFGLSFSAPGPWLGDVSVVGCSYFHARHHTYGHSVPWDRLLHEGRLVGYPEGPDGDRLRIHATLALPHDFLWEVDYTYRRQGEDRAWKPQERQGPKIEFPSGTVWREHRAGLGLDWRPGPGWLLRSRVEYSDLENIENEPGRDESALTLRFETEMRWGLGRHLLE
jgi:hypothetical protein